MTRVLTNAGIQIDPCHVREIRLLDVVGAAELHRIVFPDYFLTHMGGPFLQRFYSEFIDRSGNYGFVAICGEELVGSVIGTIDYKECFARFYRRQLPILALTLVQRFVMDPYIRRNLGSRIAHMRMALRSLVTHRQRTIPAADAPAAGQAQAHLLSIGVHPDWRGAGIAEKLVDRYCDELWHDGIEWVSLSVRPENRGAVAFYEKTGWQRVGASATAVEYTRTTRPGSAAGGGKP